jgi:hypothetical protein
VCIVPLVIPPAVHPPEPAVRGGAGAGRWRLRVPAVGWFLGIRLLGVATLAVWARVDGTSARALLSQRWDSLWYVRVAEQGYGFTLTAKDGRVLSDMAFFPLFPMLEKFLSAVLPVTPANAGLLVSLVASLVAAAGIFAVAEGFLGERAAFFTVLLWGLLPVGVVESMAYTESLFTALAAWSLYFLLRERWVAAGLLALAAGLTGPPGAALVAAVWGAVGLGVRRNGWSVPAVAGALLAPAGLAGYVLWVARRTGDLFGYLGVQRAWGNSFDGGYTFARFVLGLIAGPSFPAGLALAAGVALLLWCQLLAFRRGYPAALQIYSAALLVIVLGASAYLGSKPRLLIPAFVLLVPAATRLARSEKRTAWTVVALLCVISAGYGAFWLNGSGPP